MSDIKNIEILKELSFEEVKRASKETNNKKAILQKIEYHHVYDFIGIEEDYNSIGVKAVGTVYIPFEVITGKGKEINYKLQEIDSAGLWGVDQESKEEIKDIELEQLEELKDYLRILNVEITLSNDDFKPITEGS